MFTTTDPKKLLHQFRDDCNHMLLPAMRDFAKPWWKSNYGALSKIKKADLCKRIHDHLTLQIQKTPQIPREVVTISSSEDESEDESDIVEEISKLSLKPLAIPEKLESFEAPLNPIKSPQKSPQRVIRLYSPLKQITEKEYELYEKQKAAEINRLMKQQAKEHKAALEEIERDYQEFKRNFDTWWATAEDDDVDLFDD
jgi:hypothetical protein